MESNGYISLTITGKTPEGLLNPKDIDISETKELLSDMEIILFPTKTEKQERPKVSYEFLTLRIKTSNFASCFTAEK